MGSCYAALYHPLESKWYAPELVETVVYYRKALAVLCKVEPTPAINQLMSMICTNLGNQLSSQGRAFCAIPYFDQAILLDNNPVAYLSKARNELFIADMIEDGGHKRCHYHTAAKLLDDVEPYLQYLHPEQLEQFQNDKNLNGFKEWFHQNFEYSDFDYFDEFEEKFGSDEEALYMYWVGGNRLFLNDLNDMSDSEIVYQDVFALSSFMSNINTLLTEAEELSYHVNFDELKNDYCYARHLMYQAFESDIDDKHYYDSSFKQIESRCGVVHSLKVNHLKSSFRTFYAIFDKIGYFIHRFFDLNDISKDDKIYIDKMFKKLNSKAFKPNDKLEDGQNFFINALFSFLMI
ncbi:hypothetical protein JCM19233_6196 [Vibrio astriarenae]|nr:hypothetical protein JCM19233_6196 [Vibrio sp. C7]